MAKRSQNKTPKESNQLEAEALSKSAKDTSFTKSLGSGALNAANSVLSATSGQKKGFPILKFGLAVLSLALAVYAIFTYTDFKKYLVAAKVGNGYIFTFQLNKELTSRYGAQTLDNLVTEAIIKNDLAANNVVITNEALDAKIEEIKSTLPGITLEDALVAQGMTLADLKTRLTLSMGLEQMVKSKISVTDEEIAQFIKDYGTALTATDEAGKKEEAKKSLTNQKTQEEVGKYVEELKAKVKVETYL